MKHYLILSTLLALSLTAEAQQSAQRPAQELPVYQDRTRPIEERVADALSRMTLDEKIAMIHAQSKFSSPGVPRLGIPEVWCTDGPHGIRAEVKWDEWNQAGWTNDSITAFPALTCLAATWDPALSLLYGQSIGEEARYRNKTVLLGPGVNIYRTPLCGRNFEYMGEDPYLSARMVVPYIEGVQQQGVAACVKHYALNNNENNRNNTNVIVDERTLREIYLPAFEAAIREAHSWSLMCSYNLYQGKWLSENDRLLGQILKDEWQWDGCVISDWGAVHNTMGTVKGGLDLEYGSWTNGLTSGIANAYSRYYLADAYREAILKGEVGEEELNDKVSRILRMIFRTGMNPDRPFGSQCSEAHIAAARQIGAEGIVLLRNEAPALLPIDPQRVRKLLVVGENAIKWMTVGGGSSSLKAKYEITPLAGLRERFGGQMEIAYERGYVGDVTGEYNGVKTGQDLSESRTAEQLRDDAVRAAREADMVLFVGGLNKLKGQDAEGRDREEMALPYQQNELIEALAKANRQLCVVIVSGNAVEMPWVEQVPAVVQDWYLGSEAGHSLADILSGDVCPSGKLPFTYYASLQQCSAHTLGDPFPGTVNADLRLESVGHEAPVYDLHYGEGLLVGYRYIDQQRLRPTFPFGHGLSYTTFEYGKAKLDRKVIAQGESVTLTVPVTNTGSVVGKETVQVYVHDVKSRLVRPVKELKGFAKLTILPGETAEAVITLTPRDLSYYDDGQGCWEEEPGRFEVLVGASSADIRQTLSLEVE